MKVMKNKYYCDVCKKRLIKKEIISNHEIILKWYSPANNMSIGGGMSVGLKEVHGEVKVMKNLCDKCYNFFRFEDIGYGYYSQFLEHRDLKENFEEKVNEKVNEKINKLKIIEFLKIKWNIKYIRKDNENKL